MPALSVESADGTSIHAESFGEGRPLVVLSGALFASELWQRVVPLLSPGRSVYVVDRRGRGKSGDSALYAPEREVDDTLAVLAALPGPVDLLGHSSGALLALQAAQRAPATLQRLVVYEPPVFFRAEDLILPDLPERLDALLASGDLEGAVDTFLREGPRVSEADLPARRAGPHWASMVQRFARTVPYDARVQRAFSADPADLSRVQIPTLMLLGGASPTRMRSAAETVAARLPNVQTRELEGQEHMAMLSAPALFAAAVNEFLSAAPSTA